MVFKRGLRHGLRCTGRSLSGNRFFFGLQPLLQEITCYALQENDINRFFLQRYTSRYRGTGTGAPNPTPHASCVWPSGTRDHLVRVSLGLVRVTVPA